MRLLAVTLATLVEAARQTPRFRRRFSRACYQRPRLLAQRLTVMVEPDVETTDLRTVCDCVGLLCMELHHGKAKHRYTFLSGGRKVRSTRHFVRVLYAAQHPGCLWRKRIALDQIELAPHR